ncbi:hypothetical protein EV356DRAFT_268560 [Viridothelium virens]|uniref:Uncharacterized protein n=1 Tax=Viridothelium virens TaxID=1048519 RepID=A0A6A6HKM2_VIRVR|nr:hypothetical protein EV356DRAFT_268560 [Viridothelium virens]
MRGNSLDNQHGLDINVQVTPWLSREMAGSQSIASSWHLERLDVARRAGSAVGARRKKEIPEKNHLVLGRPRMPDRPPKHANAPPKNSESLSHESEIFECLFRNICRQFSAAVYNEWSLCPRVNLADGICATALGIVFENLCPGTLAIAGS